MRRGYLCVAHARARTITGPRADREKDPYELFAVGELLLGPACQFPLVYIESDGGSSHVSVREERSVLLIHTWTPGERRGIDLAGLR